MTFSIISLRFLTLAQISGFFLAEFGSTKTVDLIPNGSNIAVTKENRLTYIYLVSHYRLSKQIKQQSDAFFEGLSQMIDQKWLRYDFLFFLCFFFLFFFFFSQC